MSSPFNSSANLQLRYLKDRMKEVMNCVQIIEKKMDAVKVTKSKV